MTRIGDRARITRPGRGITVPPNVLRTLIVMFVFTICVSVYLPIALEVHGLHLRPSQLVLLPLLAVVACQPATRRMSWTAAGLLLGAALWWIPLCLWTSFSRVSGPHAQPLGHLALFTLNLLHFVAIYLLVVRTGGAAAALRAWVVMVACFNAVLLLVVLVTPIRDAMQWVLFSWEMAPVLTRHGVLNGQLVQRFASGVLSGCVSAAAVSAGLAIILMRVPGAGRLIWVAITLNLCGAIVGFSRQALVSVIAATLFVFAYGVWRGEMRRVLKVAGALTLATAASLAVFSVDAGGRDVLAAFLGRTVQLVQRTAYGTGTARGRVSMWTAMLADVGDNPLVGRGQDGYLRYGKRGEEGSHNLPLEVLHAGGLVALAGYLVFHVTLGWWCLSILRRRAANAPHSVLLALAGAAIAVWLASLTNLIFWNPTYWMVLALLAAAARLAEEGEGAPIAANLPVA